MTGQQIKNNNPSTQTDLQPQQHQYQFDSRKSPPMSVTKVGPNNSGVGHEVEDGQRSAHLSMLRRSKRDIMVEKAALGFRFNEIVLRLISFSIMAADKTQGWSGDSFNRYTECKCNGVKS